MKSREQHLQDALTAAVGVGLSDDEAKKVVKELEKSEKQSEKLSKAAKEAHSDAPSKEKK